MIVYSNRKCFLGLILSDYIVVQNCMDFLWFHQIDLRSKNIFLIVSSKFFFHDLRADSHTLIADVGSIRSSDQLADLVLGFLAKGTSYLSFSYLLSHESLTFPFYIKKPFIQKKISLFIKI